MTRHNLTATISSSVTENAVCWLRWPQNAQQPCPETGGLLDGGCAAGDSTRVRFYTLPTHLSALSVWNCWNSIAVMFELGCSEFELRCSESADQPRDQGIGGSNHSMIPLVAGVDLNHRPLGYEPKGSSSSPVDFIALPRNKQPENQQE